MTDRAIPLEGGYLIGLAVGRVSAADEVRTLRELLGGLIYAIEENDPRVMEDVLASARPLVFP